MFKTLTLSAKLFLERGREVERKAQMAIFCPRSDECSMINMLYAFSEHYQGVKPAARRSATDFDAIAAPAIAQMHSPAMRHFIGYIMQFQILKALCRNTTSLVKNFGGKKIPSFGIDGPNGKEFFKHEMIGNISFNYNKLRL